MSPSISIFQFVCFFMFIVFLMGSFMSLWYLFRKVGKLESNLLLSSFLATLSLSLFHNLLVNIGVFRNEPRYYLIPIWYTLSFGPILFFFVKSRLFRPFHLQKKDLKHFILPLLQASFYFSVGFRSAEFKAQLWYNSYIPFYKPIEGLFYIIGFSFYLYFSYRFIRYKLALLKRKKALIWDTDKASRLKRMVKGLVFLFVISGMYMLGDFIAFQFFGMNMYNIRGFTYIGDLSFSLIVLWVTYYAFRNTFFPSRIRWNTPGDQDLLKKKIDKLFLEGKIYLDDEVNEHKLRYFLKISRTQLASALDNNFDNLIRMYRIDAAQKRMMDSKYQNYSLESIGLDVGFSNKKKFLKAFKSVTHTDPVTYRRNL